MVLKRDSDFAKSLMRYRYNIWVLFLFVVVERDGWTLV